MLTSYGLINPVDIFRQNQQIIFWAESIWVVGNIERLKTVVSLSHHQLTKSARWALMVPIVLVPIYTIKPRD